MLEMTSGYKSAIVGDVRKMLIKAIIDISDPDMVYGVVNDSGKEIFSKPEQLHDKEIDIDSHYVTLERNRWLLDGSFRLIPENNQLDGEIGFVGNELSRDDGTFANPVWAELTFSNVYILQACSIYFSQDEIDGIPTDFTVTVYSGDNPAYSRAFTNNTSRFVSLDRFTVYNPTAIRVTVTRWSLPSRRMRISEIIVGIYEQWTDDILASVSIQQRGSFSSLALPYGTCKLRMDNLDRRFEPRNKSGIFQSIEERQAIPIAIGCELPSGAKEYKQVGVYFQANGGWKTSDNAMTMEWDLVDIVGLLSDREYIAPTTLPTTLGGWFASLVSQLGENFSSWYHVDENYANAPATVNAKADVAGKKCGDIIRWLCMATGTWARADAETGYLTAEPMWNEGSKLDLDNLNGYPVMHANDDIAILTFKLYDSGGTELNISGNSTSSSNTITVSNPFIHTEAQARTAARQILSEYGGVKLETVGRGNPASEIGDVDTVWLNESEATTGRRMEQSFAFSNGVLKNCRSVLLQADGSFMFQNRRVFTENGSFTVPSGVSQIRIILVGKGQDGTDGTDGTWNESGVDGVDGDGGFVWSNTISVNAGQTYSVIVGDNAVFGQYSSANGHVYPNGFTDVQSGDSYGRTGVKYPIHGTGDGGAKGLGGVKGNQHTVTIRGEDEEGNPTIDWVTVIDNYPTNGTAGTEGVNGCVVVYWDKESET